MRIERRDSPRIPANFYAEVNYQGETERWFVNDLSQGGAYVERVQNQSPAPQGPIELRLQIPGEREAVLIQAETVYGCSDPLFAGSAVRFCDMSPRHRGLLHRWLQSSQRELQLPFPEVVPAALGINIFRPAPTSS